MQGGVICCSCMSLVGFPVEVLPFVCSKVAVSIVFVAYVVCCWVFPYVWLLLCLLPLLLSVCIKEEPLCAGYYLWVCLRVCVCPSVPVGDAG
jgi:hypothetical protein